MVLIYYYIIILLIPKTCRTPLSLEGKFPKLQIPLRNVESRKLGSPFSAKTYRTYPCTRLIITFEYIGFWTQIASTWFLAENKEVADRNIGRLARSLSFIVI